MRVRCVLMLSLVPVSSMMYDLILPLQNGGPKTPSYQLASGDTAAEKQGRKSTHRQSVRWITRVMQKKRWNWRTGEKPARDGRSWRKRCVLCGLIQGCCFRKSHRYLCSTCFCDTTRMSCFERDRFSWCACVCVDTCACWRISLIRGVARLCSTPA